MASFDYNVAAELFASRISKARRPTFGYRRFDHAGEAIRFAIEELPREYLLGAYLEVDEKRYDGRQIRQLYDDSQYPLDRREAA